MPKKTTDQRLENVDSYHLDSVFYFRENAKLPRICLFTGENVSSVEPAYLHTYRKLDNPQRILSIRTIFYIILATISAFFFIALNPRSKDVTIKFYLSPSEKLNIKKHQLIYNCFLASIGALGISLILSFDKNYIGLIALLLSFSIVVTLIWNFIFNKPFRKLRYKNDFFSLKGTHPKFLKALTQSDHLPSVSSSSAQPKVIQMRENKGVRDFRPPS